MKWSGFWASLGILFVCLTRSTEECSPPVRGPGLAKSMEPSERAKKAEIVLYGTVVASPRVKSKQEFKIEGRYSATFRLHCIIKGPKLKSLVNITGFGDFDGGFCVHSTALLNKTYVVFVKNVHDTGELRLQEVNVQKGSLHIGQVHKPDNLAVLRDIVRVVGANASLPLDAGEDKDLLGCVFPKLPKLKDPARKNSKQARPCRCRKKKHKHRKRKNRISKVKTLPGTGKWHEQPTLARTRRYDILTAAEEGDIEELFQEEDLKRVDPVRGSAASRPQWGFWWLVLLTFHSLAFTPIMWQNT